jgi:mannosyl-oligosaccharide alpha-1,2-mannosidase
MNAGRLKTVESLYLLWRTTGDIKWRERGWSVFEALERSTKTEYGYANIPNVDAIVPKHDDGMPR